MIPYQKGAFSMKAITQTSTYCDNGQNQLGEESKLLCHSETKLFWNDTIEQGQIKRNDNMSNFCSYQKQKVLKMFSKALCFALCFLVTTG